MKLRGLQLVLSIGRQSSPTSKGYTLVELLSVIGILGVLCAIALPSFLGILNQTKINLLAEQVRQSLKEAQLQAISEGQSYIIQFRKTNQGLQVTRYPAGSEPGTWQNLSANITPNQLLFDIPESPENGFTFTPEGDAQHPGLVFLAMGNLEQPQVNTRRCVNVMNSEYGGSYFQINKDSACHLTPNQDAMMTPNSQ
jgi:prepilin-type N-terminal cleavage/methylation domain-containing protein